MYVIYGRPDCKYCTAAIGLAMSAGVGFEYINIEGFQEDKAFILREGHKTVPQIYWHPDDGQPVHIGGYDEFKIELSDTDHKKDVPENGT